MLRVLHLDPGSYSEKAKSIIREMAVLDERPIRGDDLVSQIPNYHALIIRLGQKIDYRVISNAKRLRAIATNTTGVDHIDIDAASKFGVKIISLKGEHEFLATISSTAELTWGLILCLLRQIPSAVSDVRRGRWERNLFVGRDLRGRKLGIFGLGRIGKMVASYGKAFGMEVSFYDSIPQQRIDGITCLESAEELFRWSDIVTIHLPLNMETNGLISDNLISLLRPTSYIINTSRGAILNEKDLFAALASRRIAGAALDVLPDELEQNFPRSSQLIDYSRKNTNLIISPHIGGASYDAWEKTEVFICKKLVQYLKQLKIF